MKTRELPDKISPGDELEVQLAPFGEWPNVIEKDGKQVEVTQRFGPEDAEKIVAAFSGELLVDEGKTSDVATLLLPMKEKRKNVDSRSYTHRPTATLARISGWFRAAMRNTHTTLSHGIGSISNRFDNSS